MAVRKRPGLIIGNAGKGGGGSSPNGPQPVIHRNDFESSSRRVTARQGAGEDQRDIVESIRGRRQGLRRRRLRSRLSPISTSMLGRPYGGGKGRPAAISEKWNRGSAQTISDSSFTAIQYGAKDYTAERSGIPQIFDTTTNKWTIPPGLDGVWLITGIVQWASNATGNRQVTVQLNGSTDIYMFRQNAEAAITTMPINLTYYFSGGDFFKIRVQQNSGGNLDINGGAEITHLTVTFLGA